MFGLGGGVFSEFCTPESGLDAGGPAGGPELPGGLNVEGGASRTLGDDGLCERGPCSVLARLVGGASRTTVFCVGGGLLTSSELFVVSPEEVESGMEVNKSTAFDISFSVDFSSVAFSSIGSLLSISFVE